MHVCCCIAIYWRRWDGDVSRKTDAHQSFFSSSLLVNLISSVVTAILCFDFCLRLWATVSSSMSTRYVCHVVILSNSYIKIIVITVENVVTNSHCNFFLMKFVLCKESKCRARNNMSVFCQTFEYNHASKLHFNFIPTHTWHGWLHIRVSEMFGSFVEVSTVRRMAIWTIIWTLNYLNLCHFHNQSNSLPLWFLFPGIYFQKSLCII